MNLDHYRRACAALPGATRDVKWGNDEVYSVGAKMFAIFNRRGGRATKLSFKCDADRFLELTDRPGIVPAPYLARAHWIQVDGTVTLPQREVQALLERSHALVFAKLTRKAQADITAQVPTRTEAAT